MCTKLTCVCLLLLSLVFVLLYCFLLLNFEWVSQQLCERELLNKDVVNHIHYPPIYLLPFQSPLVWAHRVAASSETPKSSWWSVSLSGLLQRSRWLVLSRSQTTLECFPWWTGLGVACPYSSGNEWCSGPVQTKRVLCQTWWQIWLLCPTIKCIQGLCKISMNLSASI